MIPRTLRMPTLLAASVAVPYVATNAPQWAQQVQQQVQQVHMPSFSASSPNNSGPGAPSTGLATMPRPELRPLPQLEPPKAPGSDIIPISTPLEGYPSYSASDVFRMDVSKEWVYQRWPRKSTSAGSLDLYGVRVPLVTGAQVSDLAGALTYYFGPSGRVERLSFRGRTGDTTQIVMLATQRFGLTQQATLTPAEQLFETRRGADVISRLRTRPAPVLWESSPHDSFAVELDLQQPDTGKPIVAEMPSAPVAKAAQPAGPTPGQVAASPAAPQNSAAAPAAKTAAAESKSSASGWRAFFPRSRVPKNQLDDLNMPRQLW